MSTSAFDRVPFLASGRSLEAVRDFLATRQARNEDARRLVRSVFGLDADATVSLVHRGSFYIGFNGVTLQPGESIDRFKPVAKLSKTGTAKGETFLVPNKRTKAGKAFAEALEAIRRPGAWDFTASIGLPMLELRHTGECAAASFERVGEWYIIHVPHHPDAVREDDEAAGPLEVMVPPDAIRLKLSEYHSMKEAAEAAREATPS